MNTTETITTIKTIISLNSIFRIMHFPCLAFSYSGKFLGGAHSWESIFYLSTKQTQCVPLFGCKFTRAEYDENSPSLTYVYVCNDRLFSTCCKYMLFVPLIYKMT